MCLFDGGRKGCLAVNIRGGFASDKYESQKKLGWPDLYPCRMVKSVSGILRPLYRMLRPVSENAHGSIWNAQVCIWHG